MAIQTSRRTFIKAGILGVAVLATAGGVYRSINGAKAPQPFVLDHKARIALRAISASMLPPFAPAERNAALERAVDGTQAAIAGLPRATQKEIEDLFGLLLLAPTRRFLVGLANDWEEAKPADVAAFLDSWRFHRIQMLQGAYAALHDLILGPWYASPDNWAGINYPGPIKELS